MSPSDQDRRLRAAPPPRRPSRVLDLRLLLGLVLVLASVAGVVGITAAADRSVAVYAAAGALLPGERVGAEQLTTRRVVLDGADAAYLPLGSLPDGGLLVVRTVAEGELVPRAAVGGSGSAESASVVVAPGSPLGSGVAPGAPVALWAARPGAGDDEEEAGAPRVLAEDALVVAVDEGGGLVGGGEDAAVELLVPRERLAAVLQAVADDEVLSIVPAALHLEPADG